MKATILLGLALTLKAQQAIPPDSAQLPPQQLPLPPAPKPDKNCIPSSPATPLKRWHLPASLQRALDKQRAEIERKTGIHVPTPEEVQKSMKPCPAPPPQAPQQ